MKKIIVDLNFLLVALDGQCMDAKNETSNCGKFLAKFLASATEGNAIKIWGWAQEFYQGRSIELDQSDFDMLLKFVKANKNMPAVGKAQIELALMEAEKKSNA